MALKALINLGEKAGRLGRKLECPLRQIKVESYGGLSLISQLFN